MQLESQVADHPENPEPWLGMPTTRYQGSKKKLLPNLYSVFSKLEFQTCLDAFGGTGSVTHLLRKMGKTVTYNDIMPSNVIMAKALFSARGVGVTEDLLRNLFKKSPDKQYNDTIQRTYRDIYFTQGENVEIDTFCQNLALIKSETLRAEAFYLLSQSLLSKRPYNLFHRANLRMRLKEVKRSFGNKATWDKPIIEHCLRFLKELRVCRNPETPGDVKFLNSSAFQIQNNYDLIYIDPPYAKSKGTQESNYFNFYHFLDALLAYDEIENRIHPLIKHKPFYEHNKPWHGCAGIDEAFCELFDHYKNSQLVISYRDDGVPSVGRLVEILTFTHKWAEVLDLASYKYALSTKQTDTKEVVIVAYPEG